MRNEPLLEFHLIFEVRMVDRKVSRFRDIRNDEFVAKVPGDSEPDRVALSLFWQARTTGRIAQIAGLADFVFFGQCAFVTRSAAVSLPSAAQR